MGPLAPRRDASTTRIERPRGEGMQGEWGTEDPRISRELRGFREQSRPHSPFIPSPRADQSLEVARMGARGEGTGRPVACARKSSRGAKKLTVSSTEALLLYVLCASVVKERFRNSRLTPRGAARIVPRQHASRHRNFDGPNGDAPPGRGRVASLRLRPGSPPVVPSHNNIAHRHVST